MLNDPFVRTNARLVADRVRAEVPQDQVRRIEAVYALTLGRSPSKAETERAIEFVRTFSTAWNALPQDESAESDRSAEKVAAKKPAAAKAETPVNPDEIITQDIPAEEVKIRYEGADEAALAHFVQALFASAEFRYVR